MLFDRQAMNSTNSSLPPTTDKKRRSRGKDKKKRKKKGENSVGGQDGHAGTTLTQYEDADEIIEIPIDRRALPAGEKFTKAEPETRQVIDLNIEFVVREYQAEVFKDQFDLRISQGTLCNFNREAFEKLEDFELNIIHGHSRWDTTKNSFLLDLF